MAGIIDFLRSALLGSGHKKDLERRNSQRQTVSDGKAVIDGVEYSIKEWSENGCHIGPTDLNFTVGHRSDAHIHIPAGQRALEFSCKIIVLRNTDSSGSLAVSFKDLEKAIEASIHNHFASLED